MDREYRSREARIPFSEPRVLLIFLTAAFYDGLTLRWRSGGGGGAQCKLEQFATPTSVRSLHFFPRSTSLKYEADLPEVPDLPTWLPFYSSLRFTRYIYTYKSMNLKKNYRVKRSNSATGLVAEEHKTLQN